MSDKRDNEFVTGRKPNVLLKHCSITITNLHKIIKNNNSP